MQCKQAHEYAHIKCNQSKFMSLLPLLVCFSCPRILILLNSSMLLPLCPLSMSKTPIVISLSQSLPKLLYLCTISPPLSSISIKDVLLIDAKARIGEDGWDLNLVFFMDITWLLEWHYLYSSLDTMCRILWPWYQLVWHLPLCHSMGHSLDKLELL